MTRGPAEDQKDPAEDQKDHIKIIELKATKLSIFTFTRMHPDVKSIHLKMDKLVDLSYIAKVKGTHSKFYQT